MGAVTVRAYAKAIFSTLALSAFLTGCVEEPSSDDRAAEATSRTLRPSDTAIAKIYDRSCRNCHTIAATGAPLTGDSIQWATRLDKGMETLIDNVVSGVGTMPPFGMCMDCQLEEFKALILFMAQARETRADNG